MIKYVEYFGEALVGKYHTYVFNNSSTIESSKLLQYIKRIERFGLFVEKRLWHSAIIAAPYEKDATSKILHHFGV